MPDRRYDKVVVVGALGRLLGPPQWSQQGELSAAIELRRLFPGITDNVQARECARVIACWQPLPPRPPGGCARGVAKGPEYTDTTDERSQRAFSRCSPQSYMS
jgi:hypothetical protein